MSFTPDEIKNIEIIVEGIEKVIEVISLQLEQFVYDRSTKTHRLRDGKTVKNICEDVYIASGLYLTISVPPSNLIEEILAKLYWDKPEIAKDLKETYYRFVSDVLQLFTIKDADNLYDELFSVQYKLSDLARTLQAGSKIAKTEAKQPTETDLDFTPTKWRKAWTCTKGFVKEAYRITIKSFFDSVMNK
jgi:hypothetical protein